MKQNQREPERVKESHSLCNCTLLKPTYCAMALHKFSLLLFTSNSLYFTLMLTVLNSNNTLIRVLYFTLLDLRHCTFYVVPATLLGRKLIFITCCKPLCCIGLMQLHVHAYISLKVHCKAIKTLDVRCLGTRLMHIFKEITISDESWEVF